MLTLSSWTPGAGFTEILLKHWTVPVCENSPTKQTQAAFTDSLEPHTYRNGQGDGVQLQLAQVATEHGADETDQEYHQLGQELGRERTRRGKPPPHSPGQAQRPPQPTLGGSKEAQVSGSHCQLPRADVQFLRDSFK